MKNKLLVTSGSLLATAFLLAGCTGSGTPEPSATPTAQATLAQQEAHPVSLDEAKAFVGDEEWTINLPEGLEGYTTHTLNEVSYALPNELADISADVAAPEAVRVYAKPLSDEQAMDANAPVENIYVYQIALKDRIDTLVTLEEQADKVSAPLEQLMVALARQQLVAFPESKNVVSGPVVDAAGTTVGYYVTAISSGERLTTVEVLKGDNVYMFSSTITGEVEAPEYIKNITLS